MKQFLWLAVTLSLFILGCTLDQVPEGYDSDLSQRIKPRPTSTPSPNPTPQPAIPAVPILDEPANGATNVSFNIGLFWNRATAVSGTLYHLQLSTSTTFTNNLLDVNVDYNAYAAINLSRNTTYYWRVNATIGSITSAWSVIFRFTTLDLAAPTGVPTLVSPADGASGLPLEPELTWNGVDGATSYDVQVAGERTFSGPIIQWYAFAGTTFIARGLEEDPLWVYYWRVRSRNEAGSAAVWSGVRSFSVEGF